MLGATGLSAGYSSNQSPLNTGDPSIPMKVDKCLKGLVSHVRIESARAVLYYLDFNTRVDVTSWGITA